MENWKKVKDFEGTYEISNFGNIKNKSGKILKPFDNKGYLRIGLSKDGKISKHLIHRLVARHFISEPPNEDSQVNHMDMNRKNNHFKNLEWTSPKENIRHSYENNIEKINPQKEAMSKIGKKYGGIGIEASKKPVIQKDMFTGEIINIFESAREASRETNSKYKNISQVCLGQKKTHNGFKWEFLKEEGQTTIESK